MYCHEIIGTDSTNYSSVPLLNAPMQLSIYDHSYECEGNEETLCECPTEMEQCQSNQVSEVECREPSKYYLVDKFVFSLRESERN